MDNYLIAQGVLCLLMVTTTAIVGLLGLWAGVSQWPWFVRATMIVGLLSPLLLRPMHELFVTLLTQVIVTLIGVALFRNRGALWDTLRGNRKLLRPQFTMRSLLAAMGLAGIAAATAAAMSRHLDLIDFSYPLPFGVVAGTTTLLAAWWTADGKWTSRLVVLMFLIPLVYAFQQFDYLYVLAPTTNFWPYGSDAAISPEVVAEVRAGFFVTAAIVVQAAMIFAWSRAIRPIRANLPRQRNVVVASVATLLIAIIPLYAFARLQFPYPIPQTLVFEGDDAAFQQLLGIADRFRRTAVWVEICKDQEDGENLATAVHRHAAEYQELHGLLDQSIRRPMSAEWIADAETADGSAAFKVALDELSRLRTICYVLDAEVDSARREQDTGAAIQGGLGMIQLAETTCRSAEFSTYLSADAFTQMGLKSVYRSIPALDESQCEQCIRRLDAVMSRKPPITKLLRYERAGWENGYGWTGHLRRVLGDLANLVGPSLDANHEEILRRLDRRSRITARLLIVELLLRSYFKTC